MPFERVLSGRLGSADIRTTQFSVHMDDLPEYDVTPLTSHLRVLFTYVANETSRLKILTLELLQGEPMNDDFY